MHKQMSCAAALVVAATLAGSPAFGWQRGAVPTTIVASVGHSEWCRPGTVRLDLGSGRYTVRAPTTWRACRRPAWPAAARAGILPARDLAAIRAAWRSAEVAGLEDRTCGDTGQGQRIVISNGGTQVLRVMRGAITVAPPKEEGCWSEPALRLQHLIREYFDPRPTR